MIIELAPGLPIVSYQTLDLDARVQAISLDGLPLGDSFTASFTSDILWDDGTQILWDDDTPILWGEPVVSPSIVELKG